MIDEEFRHFFDDGTSWTLNIDQIQPEHPMG